MYILFRIILLFLLAKHCQQTPVVETTEDFNEEFIETTTRAHIVEKTKDEIIADLENKLNNMRRHVAAFKSKSQADAAKVLNLSDLIVAYESQIDSNSAIIEALETNVKNLNSSVNSYRGIFVQKELEITDLQIKTKTDALNINEYLKQISNYQDQLKFSQASSCVPFGNFTGIQLLHLPRGEPFYAPCESRLQQGFGWTVIQRRLDGTVNFYRNWDDYSKGFGDLSGEFFIGLDKLHRMTSNEQHELLIYYQSFDDSASRYYRFNNFLVGNETENYLLKEMGGLTCHSSYNCQNPMISNVGMKFTTYDRDNDNFWWQNCAKECHGAWWFNSCIRSKPYTHLNGAYDGEITRRNVLGVFMNDFIPLKYVQMMIRPKKF